MVPVAVSLTTNNTLPTGAVGLLQIQECGITSRLNYNLVNTGIS